MGNQETFKEENKIEINEYLDFGNECTHTSSVEFPMGTIQEINYLFLIWSSMGGRSDREWIERIRVRISAVSKSLEALKTIPRFHPAGPLSGPTTFHVSISNLGQGPHRADLPQLSESHSETVISYCPLPIGIGSNHVDEFRGEGPIFLSACIDAICFQARLEDKSGLFSGKYSVPPRIASHASSKVCRFTRNIFSWPERPRFLGTSISPSPIAFLESNWSWLFRIEFYGFSPPIENGIRQMEGISLLPMATSIRPGAARIK